ncbi:metal homeostatis protein BSD2 [Elsinoe australis]|uniref:Metal homeostatis protein BSD2 n=1 Tax=Elsinoe australis TaxID=40998 RepID=A0A4V6DUP2_9PEZI|nr:metal homeostatis protein BSD2 [Elsinoe australis]
MSPQRYERVAEIEDDDLPITDNELHHQDPVPNSPPPSFRSHASSRRSSAQHHTAESEVERSLDDAFGGSHDSDDDEDEESRRLVSRTNSVAPPRPGNVERRNTEFPSVPSAARSGQVYGGGSSTRDGVFANISAKPVAGVDDLEEKPPTYEQAAADATPPYWETTILTPGGYSSDDVFVDGLMVGSMFSFVWNALISMSFQLIGFLLTYLLHTTHAAKHGSRAGLGITLIQYGFTFRSMPVDGPNFTGGDPDPNTVGGAVPSDPNSHDFDPHNVAGDANGPVGGGMMGGGSSSDWISYVLMIAGWFLLIKASSDFVRARRQEMLIRNSENRGLPVPIVAEGEGERAV